MSKAIDLDFTQARPLTEYVLERVLEYSVNGFEVTALDPAMSTPIPWDTSVDVDDSPLGRRWLILDGGVGPSGFGFCRVKVPVDKARDVYRISVTPTEGREYDLLYQLAKCGIVPAIPAALKG